MREKITEVIWAFIIAFFFIALLMILTPADAAAGNYDANMPGFLDGAELHGYCVEGQPNFSKQLCLGYVAGIYDSGIDDLVALVSEHEGFECEWTQYSIGDLMAMVQWVFRDDSTASSPDSDASMVVMRAIVLKEKCTSTDGDTPKHKT